MTASAFSQNTTPRHETHYRSRLMVDGNTELRVRGVAREFFSDRLSGLLSGVDKGEDQLRLIVPARPWTDAAKPGAREALAVSRGWRTGKPRARTYHLEVPGAFHVTYSERHSTVTVQLAASMLWSAGYAAAAAWSIRALHVELFWHSLTEHDGRLTALDTSRPLETAASSGWAVRRVELCSDLTNYPRDADATHVGFRGKPTLFGVDVEERTCETLSLGGGTSACRLRVYDKTTEVLAGGDDSTWKYAEVWKRNGWTEGEKLTRVELVMQETGLAIESKEAGEGAFDLRDPAALADPESLSKAWRFHATKKRRIVPEHATRRERCRTHPAWAAVIEAADEVEGFEPLDHRQRREAQARACDTMAERDRAVMTNAALRFAARELGVSSLEAYATNPDGSVKTQRHATQDDRGELRTIDNGEPVVDIEKTAEQTRAAIQLGLEAMVASLDVPTLARKAAYLERYFADKSNELGEEMRDRASRYIEPPHTYEAWGARRTHREPEPSQREQETRKPEAGHEPEPERRAASTGRSGRWR